VWEERQNGHRYFYLSRRLPAGRIRKEYFGKGLRAEVESIRLEQKARQRQEDTQRKVVLAELDSMAEEYASSARFLVEAHLYAAGYHNPKSRGWRKRRNELMIRPMECENQVPANTDLESGELVTEQVNLEEVVRRCRSGDRDAVVTLRRVMQEHPDMFSSHGHIAAKVQTEWIRAISGPDLFEREMLLKSTRELRQGLLEEGTGSHLEQLVVDQVVASHLEQGFHQLIEARCVGKGVDLPKYQVDSSQRATRRHEKTLSALSTIRTLAPKLASETEPVIEATSENHEQTTWHIPLEANRLSAVFDRTLHPVPMN
tara:strand:- start:22 stop:966 length:945 start_codon:yes stop_codon:yes gene_type:complete